MEEYFESFLKVRYLSRDKYMDKKGHDDAKDK